MARPSPGYGMRHVALRVKDLAACEHFYVSLLGMQVEWRPDDRSLYLTSGGDNLALHQADLPEQEDEIGRLDHIGFFVKSAQDVDQWFAWLREQGVPVRTNPRTHRDGARSFYCEDPEGVLVQIIHHPPVCAWEKEREERGGSGAG
ncbi:VOC family protein [Thiolapillus sp.]